MQIYGDQTQLALDLVGVFFFAVSGALLAARKGFDVVASFMLAGMTGLGGGIVRDVLIGDEPAALEQPVHLVPAGLAVVIVYLFLSLFRPDDIYALPAVAGSVVAAVTWNLDAMSAVTGVAASLMTFVLRALALRHGWRAPLAHRRVQPGQ